MKKQILLAEDNDANRNVLERILTEAGFDAVAARNWEEAVDHFRKEQPELVVMGINMPKMDGFKAAEKIRQQRDILGAPIIFISSAARIYPQG